MPIGVAVVKRHYPWDLERFRNLIVLERDPVEAIRSHRRTTADDELPDLARRDADWIQLLRRTYEDFSGPKLTLRYEDFASDVSRLDALLDWLNKHDPRLQMLRRPANVRGSPT